MGLFTPRPLKNLERELEAARIALSMLAQLPPGNQERVRATAPAEILGAARAAAQAGHSSAAVALLDREAARAFTGEAGTVWASALSAARLAIAGVS